MYAKAIYFGWIALFLFIHLRAKEKYAAAYMKESVDSPSPGKREWRGYKKIKSSTNSIEMEVNFTSKKELEEYLQQMDDDLKSLSCDATGSKHAKHENIDSSGCNVTDGKKCFFIWVHSFQTVHLETANNTCVTHGYGLANINGVQLNKIHEFCQNNSAYRSKQLYTALHCNSKRQIHDSSGTIQHVINVTSTNWSDTNSCENGSAASLNVGTTTQQPKFCCVEKTTPLSGAICERNL